MAENSYDTDGFKTVVLRVDKATRDAVPEGIKVLHYGDSVTFVITEMMGCDPSDLVFGAFDADSVQVASLSGSFAFVPGTNDKVYANVSFATAEALAAVSDLPLGDPATLRLYLYESGGKTWLDTSMDIFPEPVVAYSMPNPPPVAGNAYVTQADLAAALAPVLAMPTLTAAQRESRMDALLQILTNL